MSFRVLLISLLIFTSNACSARSVYAERCYVVEGNREQSVEVDALARDVAFDHGYEFEGENSSALVIWSSQRQSRIVMSAPFGHDAAIIAAYRMDEGYRAVDLLLTRLVTRLEEVGLEAIDCSRVSGLQIPSIHGSLELRK